MDTFQAMYFRKSVRSFTGEAPTDKQMELILGTADVSPVGRALYENVHLTIINDADLLAKIDAAAAKLFGNPDLHPLYGAPTMIVVSSKLAGNFDADNIASANVAMIVHNMSLTAVGLGLGHCDIWGAMGAMRHDPELMAEAGIPEGFAPLGAIILGKTEEKYGPRENVAGRISRNFVG